MLRNKLSDELAIFFAAYNFPDYCPNGLQVAGSDEINTIVSGVSANQALIDEAIETEADAILVHHGFFFKGEMLEIVEIKKNRIAALLQNNISLFAYHLPLDLHPEIGNNVLFGNAMGWLQQDVFALLGVASLGRSTILSNPIMANELTATLTAVLDREPLHIAPDDNREIKKIAWCTGAAQDGIRDAYLQGADAYLSGEVSERTFSAAKEYGLHYFACGHHATERFGVKALGDYCATQYGLQHVFIDIVNPV